MWPALSITKPDPSAFWVCVWGTPKLKNGSELVLITCVEVTCTTPGASSWKILLIDSPLPGFAVSNEVGELPPSAGWICRTVRSEEHTSELQSQSNLVCRLLLEKNT